MFDLILFEAGMNSCEFRNCYVTLDQSYVSDHCETRINPPFSSMSTTTASPSQSCQHPRFRPSRPAFGFSLVANEDIRIRPGAERLQMALAAEVAGPLLLCYFSAEREARVTMAGRDV